MRSAVFAIALATFGLPAAAWAGTVEGTVIDARGLPVAEAQVALDDARSAVTAADGTYRFTDVAEGEREVSVALATGTTQRVWVDVAAQGASRRDIFLLSPAAVDRAMSAVLPPALPEGSLEATYRLAQQIAEESAAREGTVWRWRDRDA